VSEVILGILSILCGAAINNLGIVLQKRQVAVRLQVATEAPVSDIVVFMKDRIWAAAILMQTVLVWPFFLYGLSVIGLTLAQPLSNSGIIVLVVGVIWILHENLSRLESIGVALLVFGVVSVGLGNIVGEITLESFLQPESLAAMWLLSALIVILSVTLAAFGVVVRRARLVCLGLLSGVCYAGVSISMQVFSLSLSDLSHEMTIPLFGAGLVGTVAGTVLGIVAFQEAFKRGRATNIIPFAQITMNLLPILAGLLVFGQTIAQPLFFWMGVLCIIAAASLLARFQEPAR